MAVVQVSSIPRCGSPLLESGGNGLTIRFDWFFKSRTPDELKRRGQTLMLCVMKDAKPADEAEFKPAAGANGTAKGGKKRPIDELKAGSRDTTPSVQGGAKKSESTTCCVRWVCG